MIKPIGYNRPLYILAFGNQGSLKSNLFTLHCDLTPTQSEELAQSRQIIYDGFKVAVAAGILKEKAGILIDEQLGADILWDARANGFVTACPVDKSGLDEFDFKHGEDFAKHIEAVQPSFCKALVRYNPEGDFYLNRRQLIRLKRLSDYLRNHGKSRFMVELLVPPERAQLHRFKGDKKAYDVKLRPKLILLAIHQLQNCGIEPDVWAIEGLERHEDYEHIVDAAQRDGRDQVGCIVLGGWEDEDEVCNRLMAASAVKGFIGFAVEPVTFWDTLTTLKAKEIGRERAVWEIARSFQWFADIYEQFAPIDKSREKKRQDTIRHYWDRWLMRKHVSALSNRVIDAGH